MALCCHFVHLQSMSSIGCRNLLLYFSGLVIHGISLHSYVVLLLFLLFNVLTENFAFIHVWIRHHFRRGAAKCGPLLGAYRLWAGRDLYRVTSAVTRDLGSSTSSKGPPYLATLYNKQRVPNTDSIRDPHGNCPFVFDVSSDNQIQCPPVVVLSCRSQSHCYLVVACTTLSSRSQSHCPPEVALSFRSQSHCPHVVTLCSRSQPHYSLCSSVVSWSSFVLP